MTQMLHVIGRLAPGVKENQANAEMNRIAQELAREYPATNAGRSVDVMPLSASIDPYARRYIAIVALAVGFLLVLACANVANIQLLRGAVRGTDIAVRAALGASRARIARQLLTEGVLLSLAGVLLGLPLAMAMLRVIKTSIPALVMRHLPGLPYAELDQRILLSSIVVPRQNLIRAAVERFLTVKAIEGSPLQSELGGDLLVLPHAL